MTYNKTLIEEITLTSTQQSNLINILPFINTTDESSMIRTMHVFGFILQNTIFNDEDNLSILQDFKEGKSHVLIIRNFPIETQLPPTPYTGFCPTELIKLSTSITFGMMGILNLIPVTYSGENDNKLIRHVVPSINAANDVSSHGSKLPFGFHVDNPDLSLVTEKKNDLSACPEYLSLQSIRCDHTVPTKLLILDDIIKILPKKTVETLCKSIYNIKRPASFVGNNICKVDLPVLSYDDHLGVISRFDNNNVTSDNIDGREALECFIETVEKAKIEHKLVMNPGDYLIFRNQKTLHARDSFKPKMDGTDRWLIRLFGLSSLDKAIPINNNIPYVLKS